MNSNDFCEKILFSSDDINKAVSRVANEINRDYSGQEIVFVVILNGAFMFATDLVKQINQHCYIDFMQCSTYGNGSESTNKFLIKKDLSLDINGKHVIIIEDILDSGYTLKNLIEYLQTKNPKSVKTAVFMDKTARRKEIIDADYCAVKLEKDEFIIGYGLDYAQRYRNLPFVGVLKEEIYK